MYENTVKPVSALTEAARIYAGGLCPVYFTPFENVLEWPPINPLTGRVDGTIVLRADASIYLASFNPQTKEFTEATKESPAGDWHEMVLNATLPGNSAENILSLNAILYHRHFVLFKDKHGEWRFFGNEDYGAKASYQYTSGDFNTSRNRKIKFAYSGPNAAPIYRGDLPEIAEGLFLITDDGDFIFTDDEQTIPV
jgi:hypothetical protein